jgi:hypothetical protein
MSEFAIGIDNGDNPANLILGNVYRRLPDAEAESHETLRVVNEDASADGGYPSLSVSRRHKVVDYACPQENIEEAIAGLPVVE